MPVQVTWWELFHHFFAPGNNIPVRGVYILNHHATQLSIGDMVFGVPLVNLVLGGTKSLVVLNYHLENGLLGIPNCVMQSQECMHVLCMQSWVWHTYLGFQNYTTQSWDCTYSQFVQKIHITNYCTCCRERSIRNWTASWSAVILATSMSETRSYTMGSIVQRPSNKSHKYI